jgi:hypothetical protein
MVSRGHDIVSRGHDLVTRGHDIVSRGLDLAISFQNAKHTLQFIIHQLARDVT